MCEMDMEEAKEIPARCPLREGSITIQMYKNES